MFHCCHVGNSSFRSIHFPYFRDCLGFYVTFSAFSRQQCICDASSSSRLLHWQNKRLTLNDINLKTKILQFFFSGWHKASCPWNSKARVRIGAKCLFGPYSREVMCVCSDIIVFCGFVTVWEWNVMMADQWEFRTSPETQFPLFRSLSFSLTGC